MQTWDIAWEAMKEHAPKPQVELVPELYGADPTQLLQSIRMASATDPKRLMLVGHNPGMHELALALIGSGDKGPRQALSDNLPTSGLAMFDFDNRRLERRGIPPRAAGALCQPKAAEADIERLRIAGANSC